MRSPKKHNSLFFIHNSARRGFTLIELLISIGIFIMLTAVAVMSFASGRYRDELVAAGSLVQATVREAQSLTTAGVTVRCPQLGAGDPSAFPIGGFGVYLTTVGLPEVVLFADCDPAENPLTFDASDDVVVRRVALPPRVTMGDLQPAAPLHVVFSPLSETVAVNGASYDGEATVVVEHDKTGRRVTVRVNAFTGQVFVTQPQ